MDKWFIGFAVVVIALIAVVSVLGASYFGLQEQLNQQQQEKQAELLLQEQADMNAINVQLGQLVMLNTFGNQALTEGRVTIPFQQAEDGSLIAIINIKDPMTNIDFVPAQQGAS